MNGPGFVGRLELLVANPAPFWPPSQLGTVQRPADHGQVVELLARATESPNVTTVASPIDGMQSGGTPGQGRGRSKFGVGAARRNDGDTGAVELPACPTSSAPSRRPDPIRPGPAGQWELRLSCVDGVCLTFGLTVLASLIG